MLARLPVGPPALSVPEELSDLTTLTESLVRASAAWRSSGQGGAAADMCRLLEAAASALQAQVAEAKVQRGLAVASQTLAAELSLKCERLAQSTLALTPPPVGGSSAHAGTTADASRGAMERPGAKLGLQAESAARAGADADSRASGAPPPRRMAVKACEVVGPALRMPSHPPLLAALASAGRRAFAASSGSRRP